MQSYDSHLFLSILQYTADEPKKKKNRTKKKKSAKNRAGSGKKTAKGANNTPEQTNVETGAMEANESGESDENDDDREDEENTAELQISWRLTSWVLSSGKAEQSYLRRKSSVQLAALQWNAYSDQGIRWNGGR